MRYPARGRIFAHERPADLIGRSDHIERLLEHAAVSEGPKGLMLLATPMSGTSELLRQAYDRLFVGGGDVIPFYFEFRDSDQTARNAATRFACEFLIQAVAFRRGDAAIINLAPGIGEIAGLALPSDGHWIERLIETLQSESSRRDEHCMLRDRLSAPLRAAAGGTRSMVMIDDIHIAARLDGGTALVEGLRDIFTRADVPFVFAGHRRFLFGRTAFETMAVDRLSFSESGRIAELCAANTGVTINEQTRDLIAVQLGGSPVHIGSLFTAAAQSSADLDSFDRVEQAYTDEIFGGRIAKRYDAVLARILSAPATRLAVLRLLVQGLDGMGPGSPLAYWQKHTGLAARDLNSVLDALHYDEIVNVSSGHVSSSADDPVLSAYITARASIEADSKPRALAVGQMLAANIERAPQLMSRFYRRSSAFGLRALLDAFDGRLVSAALLDYSRFKNELKGADADKVLKAVSEDNNKVMLPKIVFTADTSAFYPKIGELCDPERSAVALGFSDTPDSGQTVWIAAEIESKLEAGADDAEFWCDRLEMVAASCGFSQFRIWLISPEGFTDDAINVLRSRNAFGSSREQARLLTRVLNADLGIAVDEPLDEYEFVVPMGHDTEMIAARTVEEIAKRHGFPPKAINQIKTALVEACINASEHSLSTDRRIHQRFAIRSDRMTITVANRGVRLADRLPVETGADEGRRGWGLKLIKGLMDEVEIERTDDGTRLTMVKYRKTG